MKEYLIENEKFDEPVPVAISVRSDSKVLVFVSGDGDQKEEFYPMIKLFDDLEHSLACFSFRGRETGAKFTREQQIQDLTEVLDFLLGKGYREFVLVPTSMGFISVASVLADERYTENIKNVIMLDPADYPIDGSRGTWWGSHDFEPSSKLYSEYLRDLRGDCRIDVIFFGLRNFDPENRKRLSEEMGIDNPKFKTRLSLDMTKNIFNQVPETNKGEFLIDSRIPHAFSRDGDVDRNRRDIVRYVRKLID